MHYFPSWAKGFIAFLVLTFVIVLLAGCDAAADRCETIKAYAARLVVAVEAIEELHARAVLGVDAACPGEQECLDAKAWLDEVGDKLQDGRLALEKLEADVGTVCELLESPEARAAADAVDLKELEDLVLEIESELSGLQKVEPTP